jgi:glucose/arabinose dehydrogenase
MFRLFNPAAVALALVAALPAAAQLEPNLEPVLEYAIDDVVPLQASVVATNLDLPWDLVWGPDDRIWFTERTGAIKTYDPATGTVALVDTVPGVFNSSDNSGLHALFLHPDFEAEPWLYVNYTFEFTRLRLSRFPVTPTGLGPEDTLLELAGQDSHNGARFALMDDGTLLFATGDAFNPLLPQDTANPNGKILRLNLDGSVPADNPVPGNPLFSLGHRNPQGLVILPNGEIWATEHGPDADDELNRIERGRNYGWPEVRGACDAPEELPFCDAWDVVEPALAWSPTAGPSGLDWYDHPAIPQWRGCLIAGFLKRRGEPGQRIKVIRLDGAGREVLDVRDYLHEGPVIPTDLDQLYQVGVFGRIRDVLCAPDGSVYLCTSNREFNGRYVLTEADDRLIRVYNPAYSAEPAPEGDVLVYPNPAPSGASVYLKFPPSAEGPSLVRLYDIRGRLVLERTVQAGAWLAYRLGGLAPGNYLLRVEVPGTGERTVRLQVRP